MSRTLVTRLPGVLRPCSTSREQVVTRFAGRAFRREGNQVELAPYLEFLEQQAHSGFRQKSRSAYAPSLRSASSNSGQSHYGVWHEAMIRTFASMMSSVDFLYLREDSGELDSFELANRLSYFLWSTMPDTELIALARSGKLTDPALIQEQVIRLLDDKRSIRFPTVSRISGCR